MALTQHVSISFSLILQASLEVLELDNASLWFSGKEMLRGKKLKDFVGKNEKTKIICKIQKVSISQHFTELKSFAKLVLYQRDKDILKIKTAKQFVFYN